MEKHPFRASLWKRGCQDTVHGWKSVYFILLEAILAPLLGLFVEWWWSIIAVAGGLFCIWLSATIRAPVKQRNEARKRVYVLEEESIPGIAVRPNAGRRQFEWEHEYLMWAELEVTNTSPSQPLCNVEVRLARRKSVALKQDTQDKYVLLDDALAWNPTSAYWSERNAPTHEIRVSLSPGETKSALIAYQNNSNGSNFVFNALTSPFQVRGSKIDIEITSLESAPLHRSFYIECTPHWLNGPQATMVFTDWNDWASSHTIVPSIPDIEEPIGGREED